MKWLIENTASKCNLVNCVPIQLYPNVLSFFTQPSLSCSNNSGLFAINYIGVPFPINFPSESSINQLLGPVHLISPQPPSHPKFLF